MAVISDWDRTTSSDWEFLAGRLSYDATNDWIENNNGYGTTAQYTVDGTTADLKVTATFYNAIDNTANSVNPAMFLRHNAATGDPFASSGIRVVWLNDSNSLGQVLIYEDDSLAQAPTFTAVTGLGANATSWTATVELNGTAITLYVNGSSVWSGTTTAAITGNYTALTLNGLTGAEDNVLIGWKVEDLTAATAIRRPAAAPVWRQTLGLT